MKTARYILCLTLAAVLLLAGCGKQGDGHITLTIMGKSSDLEKSYMKTIFDRYEQATGNTLKVIEYEDATFEVRAAGEFEAGRAPDLFMHFHNADLARFDVAGNFLYMNDQPWVDDLTDGARAYCTDADGNLLGLPFWENSISGCYYNKTILDELGLKPATTQAEFDTLCQALVDIGYRPICWPGNGCSWMIQFGLDPLFADDPETLEKLNSNEISYADIPAVEDMVRWIANAAEKGWFGSDYTRIGWDDIGPVMSSGDAVMTFIWDTWFYTDMTHEGQYDIEDFALMPVFMDTADGGTYEGGNLNMMMVNKNSEQLEAALDFLAFCADPENYNAAFDGISTVNCFKGQTTNIQSTMVTNASVSIAERERVSTAASRIVGYSAEDMVSAIGELLNGRVDAAGCVALMDQYRQEEISMQSGVAQGEGE